MGGDSCGGDGASSRRLIFRIQLSRTFGGHALCFRIFAHMRFSFVSFLSAIVLLPFASAEEAKLQPKVVVVAMFEVGADKGDTPGELQFWVEREHLDRVIPLPAAYHDVRANADGSVIAILTGVGNTNAAASITALGCDPRFDLS